jgi:hypothetical protein
LAEQGFTHVAVNGLAAERPHESGPPGDVYSWFYDYSPDLDQFVSSSLLEGYYPKDYLKANLELLQSTAALAVKHGLVPGLHINSPRSLPDEFWARYPFLRGARIDHPRESFQPRYALAMAHPAVQQHYRELLRNLMSAVPKLGFIHVWTNDSGSGFEFVTSLYAGRNGGPYLIREWKKDDEIAQTAAENVLTYYRLLRDEARRVNPQCRVVCDLGSFYAERKYIAPGLGDGLDAGAFGSFEGSESQQEREQLKQAGALIHHKLDLADNNVLGVPYPSLVYERLQQAFKSGATCLLANVTPRSLAPYDVNGEIVRSVQLDPGTALDEILTSAARQWVTDLLAQDLVKLWMLSDAAVRAYPPGIPYSTFAFPWFRFWVRPFVPNIEALPESERSYYERFLLATFNNPARVDLNNDMMWNFLSVKEAGEKKESIDRGVVPPLNEALEIATKLLQGLKRADPGRKVFEDLRDRLRAARCFFVTMRNSVAWTESVHGYLQPASDDEKERYRTLCRTMVTSELENAKNLLNLWNESDVDWMPVSQTGETLHIYGENFGDHVRRKIALMQQHIDDEPFIDRKFMWRMK